MSGSWGIKDAIVGCGHAWYSVGEYLQYFTLPRLIHMESMEWGVDCRNSRWIPYFWWMDSLVFPYGFHTFSTWIPYLFHMDSMTFLMDSMDFPDEFQTFGGWIPWTFHMEWVHGCTLPSPTDSGWTPHGLHMDSINPPGLHLDSIQKRLQPTILFKIHLDSTWTPPGIQVGFHMELIQVLYLV